MPFPSALFCAFSLNMHTTDNVRIREIKELWPPLTHLREFPLSAAASELIVNTRNDIVASLNGKEDRLLVVVGPCSIHDVLAAQEYGQRLLALRQHYADELLVVMRVYFEKPRTTMGWKGLINDPHLDESFDINAGLRLARGLLLTLNNMGMPAATEFLDMITPQYLADLISWGAIGARTAESQVHRELASGLSCPVGFKNGTDGNLRVAIDALTVSRQPHHFLSITQVGHAAIVATTGNPDCHLILRGGREPNYSNVHVQAAAAQLAAAGVLTRLMVDFSHANSGKDYRRQCQVADNVRQQLKQGEQAIFGVMIESHLIAGRQDLKPKGQLVYGQSITDSCLGWENTEQILMQLAQAVKERRRIFGR